MIRERLLVAERMKIAFTMVEEDVEGNPVRSVEVALDAPDSISHDEITEAYQNFLSACGFVINGEIVYVPWEKR